MTRIEVAHVLGLSKSTVSYHARHLGLPMCEKFNRRYDWAEVQRYYDEGHSITECQKHFGFARQTWHQARKRGAIQSRPQAMPVDQLFVAGPKRNRNHLKMRLFGAGLKDRRCERCGIDEWCGEPLFLELHHVNGDGNDNRLENLEILCPNCHSQTPNFGSLNSRRTRVGAAARLDRLLIKVSAEPVVEGRRVPFRGIVT